MRTHRTLAVMTLGSTLALAPVAFAGEDDYDKSHDATSAQSGEEQMRHEQMNKQEPATEQQAAQSEQSGASIQLSQAAVRKIQQKLEDEGYTAGPADGIWGEETASAVQKLQQEEGIESTGELDVRTLSALGIELGELAEAEEEESEGDVAARERY